MTPLTKISTNAVKIADRLAQWQEFNAKAVGRPMRTLGDGSFQGTLEYAIIADVYWCKVTASSHRIEQGETFRSQSRVHVIFQLKGQSYRKQGDRAIQMSAGEWTISDLSKPYVSSSSEDIELLVLGMPAELVSTRSCDMGKFALRPFSGLSGVGKLAYEFGQDVFGQLGTLRSEFDGEIVQMVSHLIRLSLREFTDEATLSSHKSILCDRIKSYILSNLHDPSLDIDRIAEVHRCTKRYLHKAFEGEGKSISEYIWQLRLDRCRDQLLSLPAKTKSITEIALSCGFNSSAHFSTVFKRRFGVCPRGLRMDAARSTN